MKRVYFEILILVALIFVLIFSLHIKSNSVCIDGKCFSVQLAKTQKEQESGLMYRNQLSQDKGMLFIFKNPGIYTFWMKNTLISLDILWIDINNKIIYISKKTPPCTTSICNTYGPSENTKYVLEINGGISDKENFKVGDLVKINAN